MKSGYLFSSICLLSSLALGTAHAAITVDVADASGTPGSTAFVEVYVGLTGGSADSANGYNLSLTLPALGDAQFGSTVSGTVDRTMLISATNLINPSSSEYQFNIANDTASNVALFNEAGLARVPVLIPSDAVAGQSYTIDVSFAEFYRSDVSDFTPDAMTSGVVNVVPEPTGLMLLGGMLGGLVLRRRARA